MDSESQKVDELVSTIESAIKEEIPEQNSVDSSESNQQLNSLPEAHQPDFDEISRKQAELNSIPQLESTPIGRFYDVSVKVAAELGSANMTLQDLMRIREGTVITLDRNVSEPVDIMAQGVCIAKGEVVVVDGKFAVRVKHIRADS